jgi:hypothetical protein
MKSIQALVLSWHIQLNAAIYESRGPRFQRPYVLNQCNIEYLFGFQGNLFTFLAFHRGAKLGGIDVLKIYKVACILMTCGEQSVHPSAWPYSPHGD